MARLITAIVILTTADASAVEPPASAVVRLTAGNSMGSGTVFVERPDAYGILTNAHVVGRTPGRQVAVEFYRDGHQSRKIAGTVAWAVYQDPLDIAIVRVPKSSLGGFTPAVIPIAEQGGLSPNQTVISYGCARGAWPTKFVGHVVRESGATVEFLPPPANGRSGSAILSPDGKQIVGLVTWRSEASGGVGGAQSVAALWRGISSGSSDPPSPRGRGPHSPASWKVPVGWQPIATTSDGFDAGWVETQVRPNGPPRCLNCQQPYCDGGRCQPPQPYGYGQQQQPYRPPLQPSGGSIFPSNPSQGSGAPPAQGYVTADKFKAAIGDVDQRLKQLQASVAGIAKRYDADKPTFARVDQIREQPDWSDRITAIDQRVSDQVGRLDALTASATEAASAVGRVQEENRSLLQLINERVKQVRTETTSIVREKISETNWFGVGRNLATQLGWSTPFALALAAGFWFIGRRLKRRFGGDEDASGGRVSGPFRIVRGQQQPTGETYVAAS